MGRAVGVKDCKGLDKTGDNAAEVDTTDTAHSRQRMKRKRRVRLPGRGGTGPEHLSHCPGPIVDSPY